MSLTARQKIALAIAFLVLAGLGGAFWKFFWPQLKIYQDTKYDVDNLSRKFESLRAEYNYYPTPAQYLEALEPEIAKWKGAYERRAKVFTTTLRKVPPDEKEPGFHFHEQWKATRDRLLKKAEQRNVGIPPDIGFGSGIPGREDVETLLNQLSCTEYLLNLLLDNNVLSITGFSVGAPIEESGFIRLIPFQVGFVASMEDVKKFLYACGYGPQYISVETISLRALREASGITNFQVDVALTTTWIVDKPAVAAVVEGAAQGAPDGLQALVARLRAGGAATEGPRGAAAGGRGPSR